MAAGVPIIASRIGGLEEHIEDEVNGSLVEPDSVDSLREALGRALDRPEDLEARARAAMKTAKESLDVRVTAEAYRRLYAQALNAQE
jgi:glycosyltransferase involved in cell wall biosynthesis